MYYRLCDVLAKVILVRSEMMTLSRVAEQRG